jgi:hypothetical protein
MKPIEPRRVETVAVDGDPSCGHVLVTFSDGTRARRTRAELARHRRHTSEADDLRRALGD